MVRRIRISYAIAKRRLVLRAPVPQKEPGCRSLSRFAPTAVRHRRASAAIDATRECSDPLCRARGARSSATISAAGAGCRSWSCAARGSGTPRGTRPGRRNPPCALARSHQSQSRTKWYSSFSSPVFSQSARVQKAEGWMGSNWSAALRGSKAGGRSTSVTRLIARAGKGCNSRRRSRGARSPRRARPRRARESAAGSKSSEFSQASTSPFARRKPLLMAVGLAAVLLGNKVLHGIARHDLAGAHRCCPPSITINSRRGRFWPRMEASVCSMYAA